MKDNYLITISKMLNNKWGWTVHYNNILKPKEDPKMLAGGSNLKNRWACLCDAETSIEKFENEGGNV